MQNTIINVVNGIPHTLAPRPTMETAHLLPSLICIRLHLFWRFYCFLHSLDMQISLSTLLTFLVDSLCTLLLFSSQHH